METILHHMMLLLDDSIPCHDAILLDELFYDTTFDAHLLADNDAIRNVVHDPNNPDEMAHNATLLLDVLPNDDSSSLMEYLQDIPDEVVRICCIQSDVEVHGDDYSMSTRSLPDSHS